MLKGPGQPAKEKQMSTADLKDLDSLDLADPTVWDAGPPYELFARMQREAPVHFSAQKTAPGEGGFWSITRAEDVRTATREQWTDTQAIVEEIITYMNAEMDKRRTEPRDDLITALMNAEVDGEKLNELELATFFTLLMSAGNDSTRATYSATMLALLQDPEQLALLRERPELIEAAVEEALRCFPPFAFMPRAATHDAAMHGQTIKENDRVLLWYLASNRDESVFENPHKFDITREGLDQHQAFGGRGKHFCLGANLARLELKLWIQKTIERFPGLALDGQPTRVRALFLNQYNSIPVRRTSMSRLREEQKTSG